MKRTIPLPMLRNISFRLRSAVLGSKRATVLMYHSVAPKPTRTWGPWQYTIDPGAFEDQAERVARDFDPISFDTILEDEPLPENPVVVTFDDGYRDTLTTALPILEDHGIPATVFVTTGFLLEGAQPFEFAVAESLRLADRIDLALDEHRLDRDVSNSTDAMEAYDRIVEWGKAASTGQRSEIVAQLPRAETAIEMLTEPDLLELNAHPLMTIGAHGQAHIPLTARGPTEVRNDLSRCRRELEELLGEPIDYFAYPYGAVDGHVKSVVRSLEFEMAVTTRPGNVYLNSFDAQRYELPRYDGAKGLRDV